MSNPNRKPHRTLSESLAEMERTNPAVARAAANYDRMAFRFRLRRRLAARANDLDITPPEPEQSGSSGGAA